MTMMMTMAMAMRVMLMWRKGQMVKSTLVKREAFEDS